MHFFSWRVYTAILLLRLTRSVPPLHRSIFVAQLNSPFERGREPDGQVGNYLRLRASIVARLMNRCSRSVAQPPGGTIRRTKTVVSTRGYAVRFGCRRSAKCRRVFTYGRVAMLIVEQSYSNTENPDSRFGSPYGANSRPVKRARNWSLVWRQLLLPVATTRFAGFRRPNC